MLFVKGLGGFAIVCACARAGACHELIVVCCVPLSDACCVHACRSLEPGATLRCLRSVALSCLLRVPLSVVFVNLFQFRCTMFVACRSPGVRSSRAALRVYYVCLVVLRSPVG